MSELLELSTEREVEPLLESPSEQFLLSNIILLSEKSDSSKILKENGRVYTPIFIVNNILDLSDYSGEKILLKHVIDNSCGDGAFLTEIVRRYCLEFLKKNHNLAQLKGELEFYIHGIEIDKEECNKCKNNLTHVASNYLDNKITWDILTEDSLLCSRFDGKMDFVLGNPPYVRVHNLKEQYTNIKNFSYAKNGMTDLFIVFYEIGLRMLNDHGTLGYISPSSLFNSVACSTFRKDTIERKKLCQIVNLEHFQVFNATTYTTIVILKNDNTNESIEYFNYDQNQLKPCFLERLNYTDFFYKDVFYLGSKDNLVKLRAIQEFVPNSHHSIEVKNGFATLKDDFFIQDFNFDSPFLIPIIKASTGKMTKCIFPYENGKIVPFQTIEKDQNLVRLFLNNQKDLENRAIEKSGYWYGFGRSQGINDLNKSKISVNTIIKSLKDLKINSCPPGMGVYSGLYIVSSYSYEAIRKILYTPEFLDYIKSLSKYKSGGYYTFSSKDLKQYLQYQLQER
ncbi:Modification methylase PaeR7I [termite gut metagenome]|uniref:site-specific DNA-methyltransferase (adenine-specific) n=1 Tax=termite gut metagenome TaxID=433724 RepID=A0A5J4SB34_9ZZZZ